MLSAPAGSCSSLKVDTNVDLYLGAVLEPKKKQLQIATDIADLVLCIVLW